MDPNKISADDVIKKLSVTQLELIFKLFGEEEKAKQISKKIIKERLLKDIKTEDLVRIINLSNKTLQKNKATKIFQALRILVNNEISELVSALSKSCNIVSDNGVIAIVTFHSIEDRICKFF